MFKTNCEELPDYVTKRGWQIHIVRSHMRQIAIGAANSGLNHFRLQWENQRCNGNILQESCPAEISYNYGWETRFSKGLKAPAPNIFVALYGECLKERTVEGEEGVCCVSEIECLFAIVLWITYDERGNNPHRTMCYMHSNSKLSRDAKFEGLNLVDSAYEKACLPFRNRANEEVWQVITASQVPADAHMPLVKVLTQLESQFGQGKDFFKQSWQL
jgi:hypothetical protein